MLILALDSCGAACAAGLWQNGQILVQMREAMQRGQDARLMPMIVAAMEKSGYGFGDLDRIGVTRGPGSFTGTRVGLAAARGIGLAAGKPVFGIDRFAIYHRLHAASDQNILVVLESKRTELFCKYYPKDSGAHDPALLTEQEIKSYADALIVGDRATPEDDVIASCAALAAQADPDDPAFQPLPLYLRPPDVTLPAAKSR